MFQFVYYGMWSLRVYAIWFSEVGDQSVSVRGDQSEADVQPWACNDLQKHTWVNGRVIDNWNSIHNPRFISVTWHVSECNRIIIEDKNTHINSKFKWEASYLPQTDKAAHWGVSVLLLEIKWGNSNHVALKTPWSLQQMEWALGRVSCPAAVPVFNVKRDGSTNTPQTCGTVNLLRKVTTQGWTRITKIQ